MGWMAGQGDKGIGGNYMRPLGAEIQGSSKLLEVDMYRMFLLLYLITYS